MVQSGFKFSSKYLGPLIHLMILDHHYYCLYLILKEQFLTLGIIPWILWGIPSWLFKRSYSYLSLASRFWDSQRVLEKRSISGAFPAVIVSNDKVVFTTLFVLSLCGTLRHNSLLLVTVPRNLLLIVQKWLLSFRTDFVDSECLLGSLVCLPITNRVRGKITLHGETLAERRLPRY